MSAASTWNAVGSCKSLWLTVANLRQAEGDHEGAARARRSAGVLDGRSYGSGNSPECYAGIDVRWTAAAEQKYLGSTREAFIARELAA